MAVGEGGSRSAVAGRKGRRGRAGPWVAPKDEEGASECVMASHPPPDGLAPELREVWAELAPKVRRDIGELGLESLCAQVLRMRDAAGRIQREGLIVSDEKGAAVAHPAIAVERVAAAEVARWLKQYGVP